MNNLVSTKEMNNGPEIGQSIDEDRREMETGKFQPDPQFRIDDNGREILTPIPGSDSLGSLNSSEIGRSINIASDFLESLNGPEIGQSIDENGREMETGTNILTPAVSSTSLPPVRLEGSSISSRLFPNYPSAFERLLSLSSNYPSAFAEIREKTPKPKEQQTRTKPPLARKKENGVRQYTGVRQRRGGKFGAEIRDSSQKGGKRWLGNFNSAEEAAHAYDRAAYEMRRSMARLNFPDAFAFAGNNTCPTVEKPKGNASQSTPLPHPSIWAISESSASKQQHDDLEINPVKLASRFAHWSSDSHHSIHPMIIAPHVPAILSQATSLHAHQHKGGKRREISFQDMHPEVQGEMEK